MASVSDPRAAVLFYSVFALPTLHTATAPFLQETPPRSTPDSGPRYATPLTDRWNRYTVLQFPYVPTTGDRTRGVSFRVFDHFPYRRAEVETIR